MGNTWITDLQHFLDDDGQIAARSGPARRIAEHMTAIVAAATQFDDYVIVPCRRRPGRKPCRTELDVWLDLDTDDILWRCPACDDKGIISNWQKTDWDHSDWP